MGGMQKVVNVLKVFHRPNMPEGVELALTRRKVSALVYMIGQQSRFPVNLSCSSGQ